MELDKRIKSLSDILTCFDVKDAGQFLGQEGYFADNIGHFRCLAYRKYGVLTEIKDSDCPFNQDNYENWNFFIPESRLKPVEPEGEIDEINVLKDKVEKLEKNLIELQRKLNSQEPIYNPFTPWTNCYNSIVYPDGLNPQDNWCKKSWE